MTIKIQVTVASHPQSQMKERGLKLSLILNSKDRTFKVRGQQMLREVKRVINPRE